MTVTRTFNIIQHALAILQDAGIIDQATFSKVAADQENSIHMERGFHRLDRAGLLESENINIILANPQYSEAVAYALHELHEEGILTKDIKSLINEHASYCHLIAGLFCLLNQNNIFSQKNINLAIEHINNIYSIMNISRLLDDNKILTNTNFEAAVLQGKAIEGSLSNDLVLNQNSFNKITLSIYNSNFFTLMASVRHKYGAGSMMWNFFANSNSKENKYCIRRCIHDHIKPEL